MVSPSLSQEVRHIPCYQSAGAAALGPGTVLVLDDFLPVCSTKRKYTLLKICLWQELTLREPVVSGQSISYRGTPPWPPCARQRRIWKVSAAGSLVSCCSCWAPASRRSNPLCQGAVVMVSVRESIDLHSHTAFLLSNISFIRHKIILCVPMCPN